MRPMVASRQQILAKLLTNLAQHHLDGTAIVYVGTRREAEAVAAFVTEVTLPQKPNHPE
jgi:superfamily II DNA helicase RecQ